MEDWEGEITAVLSRTSDPGPYIPTAQERSEIDIKARIFAQITEAFPVSMGKHASNEGREGFGEQDSTLTYGEVVSRLGRTLRAWRRSFT